MCAGVTGGYDGVEDLAEFADRGALDRYRTSLLQRTADQAALLIPRLPQSARALEVGCGNGRLLVALARDGGPVAHGHGVDLAASRIGFARAWADDEQLSGLEFTAGDALTLELPDGADFVACITGALGYFGAMTPRLDAELLGRLAAAARPGGLVCLELYPHARERRLVEAAGGDLQTWYELPEDDPWRFYLSHFELRGQVLSHAKTFLHRTDGTVDAGRAEDLYLYGPDEIRGLLDRAGFDGVECLEGWSERPYDGGPTLVVLARRRDG